MSELKSAVSNAIRRASQCFLSDFKAIDPSSRGASPGGVARTPYDLIHELAFMNDYIASRIRRETLPPLDFSKGWMKAPAEFQNEEVAIEKFSKSVENLLGTWEGLPESNVWDEIEIPSGKTNAYESATLAARHMVYHDGQLCYLQAIHGDNDLHWS